MKKTILSIIAVSLLIQISCKNVTKSNGESLNISSKFENQGNVIQLDKASFKDRIMDYEKNPHDWIFKGEKPCVVDFYADWCKPCKMVAPIMEELAKEYEGKINIYKVNIDNEKELAQFFQIESIPAILFIPKKANPSMQAGAMTKDQYKKIFDSLLYKKAIDTISK